MVQAWVRYINDRGGVNGHVVQLTVYDDGADPARYRAAVTDAVEQRRVIAFVQNNDGVNGRTMVEYLNSKRVPVIGGDTAGTWFYDSPMHFPQATMGRPMFLSTIYALADLLLPARKTKLGILVCVEAAACKDQPNEAWSAAAAQVGFQLVYKGQASISQPDYTAECLAARSAGVEVLAVGMDANSLQRVSVSCSRQGLRPIYGSVSSVARDFLKDTPSLEGTVINSSVFPWFQNGSPAVDEFHLVMNSYAKGVDKGVAVAVGWVSAKLFQLATANLSEPPSSESVLKGLWSVRNNSLGGLTQPLTFVENQPARPAPCWYTITIKDGAWISPDQFRQHCRN